MTQLLASLTEIKTWLPDDKLPVTDGTTGNFQIEVYRLVKSQLSGVFTPTVLSSWDAPDTTPEIIRGIAGRLIAAYVYREAYSEDIAEVPQYAQTLYNEAMAMLVGVRSGTLAVLDDDGNPVSANALDMTQDDFYPNNTAPGPFFSMTKQFG